MLCKLSKKLRYFTKGERILWGVSALLIFVSFLAFDRKCFLTLAGLFHWRDIFDFQCKRKSVWTIPYDPI